MVRIHPLQTGYIQLKETQRQRTPGGRLKMFFDQRWTEKLPIYAWVIEHPEGIILVDTGDTARTSDPDYFPRWHPYYRFCMRMDVLPEQEVGQQLRRIGIQPEDVDLVILTHLHTDHAGGLHCFPGSTCAVSAVEYRRAQGISGKLRGYLPHRWPKGFDPRPVPFEPSNGGFFARSYSVTAAGDVLIVPTPGHTPGHVSVIVETDGLKYFLAGDTSYTEELLLKEQPDGRSPATKATVQTMQTILAYAAKHPTIYLPSHDPQSANRLTDKSVLQVER